MTSCVFVRRKTGIEALLRHVASSRRFDTLDATRNKAPRLRMRAISFLHAGGGPHRLDPRAMAPAQPAAAESGAGSAFRRR